MKMNFVRLAIFTLIFGLALSPSLFAQDKAKAEEETIISLGAKKLMLDDKLYALAKKYVDLSTDIAGILSFKDAYEVDALFIDELDKAGTILELKEKLHKRREMTWEQLNMLREIVDINKTMLMLALKEGNTTLAKELQEDLFVCGREKESKFRTLHNDITLLEKLFNY